MQNKIVDLNLLGKNIKHYRLKKELTQEKLARLTGLSIQYIGNIERGNTTTSLETIMKICLVLEITPNQLLITSSSPTSNALIEQIIDSLSDKSPKFLRHIIRYIEFLQQSKFI
ncbi:helix-turn-helix domain-containing protein [Vallitalea sp.]|jgi:transcriptional regulator with XRE-family HTH domain|uniref:helix-turn-helix domain-containing protein n=1 Tax=Vallitalea sp. TaxID=1882829 RepID=UPI0025D9EF25|nr:helix-turn-helix transcriptional regulator [Vallitalea sp.]MCT4686214.1 helix-turn-helix domain-containing protein [Vallitalea sp.]